MRTIMSIMVLLIGLANAEANLVVNGDFESGNTGFISSYNYIPHANQYLPSGSYFVGDNSKAWNGNFPQPMFDHTSGSGLMLLGDASNNRSIIWQQTVDVTAGIEYEFSGWVASLYYQSLPNLEFMIDGQAIGSILTHNLTWEQFSATWIALQSGPVVLSIRDLNTAWLGNDFAIDDLSFEATSTLLPPVIQIANPTNSSGCVEATGFGGAVITASVGNLIDDPSIVYYWSNSEGESAVGEEFKFELGVNESTIIFLTVEDTLTGEMASSFEQVCVSDTTSPEIIIISPEYGDTFTGNNLFLDVRITDAVDLSIENYTVSIGSTATYPLDPGTGTSRVKLSKPAPGSAPVPTDILIIAQDVSGNSSSATVQVMQVHDSSK
ncbi:MAG: hypothetical protein DRP64_05735 [Verrucomicrobia bacterium]|nr:MAG: hypothetical protein DRP64_05735 [Verrucomicrobiota bacterium]